MKTASYILDNIKDKREFKNLNYAQSFNTIKEFLPKKINEYLDFMYIRNNILYFVLKHPAIRQEFELKKNDILKMIKILSDNNRIDLKVDSIKSFTTNKITKEIVEVIEEQYSEKSNGNFNNYIKDEKIAKILEEIRENINAKK